ncbi:MAG: DUF4143 domain-containing protein [Euzebyales bacterium]|nr:DUF4143 domain-containing protein [Euzebyales bacterium]
MGLQVALHHFRTYDQKEVDVVLQDRRGRVLGIEVKASMTIRSADFSGLRALAEAADHQFAGGMVLHPGREVVPHGQGL